MSMRKFFGCLLCGMLLVFGVVSQANALAIGDSYYVGKIVDGIPSGVANEAGYINYLISLDVGVTDTYDGQYYDRTGGISGPFPTAVTLGAAKDEEETNDSFDNVIDATGLLYILGKYDQDSAGSLVWYLGEGFTGEVELPSSFPGTTLGLSHISSYNPTPTPEPATGLLYVLGIAGIAGISWKMSMK